MKYYQCVNANRLIAGIVFSITDIVAGCPWGTYQTDDPALIEKLDALTKDPKSNVTEISAADYEAEELCKKKVNGWPTLSPSKTNQGTEASLKVPVGVVQEEHPEPAEDPDKPIEIKAGVSSIEEALSTAKVETVSTEASPSESPPPNAEEPPKPAKKQKSKA